MSRGDRVTLIDTLDSQPKALAASLEFYPIGEADFPAGSMADNLTKLGQLGGRGAFWYTIELFQRSTALLPEEAPAACKAAGLEFLRIDQTSFESLSNGVPMVVIPIANDQPGVAARIVWAGAGEMVAFFEEGNG